MPGASREVGDSKAMWKDSLMQKSFFRPYLVRLALGFPILCIFPSAFGAPSAPVEPPTVMVKTEAFELKGGKDAKMVYREEYVIQSDAEGRNRIIDTKYMHPNGDVFAEMHSDFSKDPYAPDSTFTDKRFNITEIAVLDNEKRMMKVERTYKGKKKTVEMKPDGTFASGPGFNNFVLVNFDRLVLDEKLKLRFIVLDQLDEFGFDVFNEPNRTNQKLAIFTVRLSNWALRQLISPITLTYQRDNKQLRRFEGLSNLLSEKENDWNVRIEYGDLITLPAKR
jgi:hypothetical protein